jgi:hypothetical protein
VLTEIVVAAIGAAGTLTVAYIAREGPRQERRERGVPLMALSEHCGHVRGVAEAAVADCERTIGLLSGGRRRRSRVDWSAHETYEAFIEKTSSDSGGPRDFASQLRSYTSMVDEFAARLRALCETVDRLAGAPAPDQGRVRAHELRELKNLDLAQLKSQLPKLDEQFTTLQTVWLDKVRPLVPTGAPRYFSRRSDRRYSRFVTMGKNAEFVHPRVPTPPDPADSHPSSSDPAVPDAPACGHCIWQCPHAPGRNAAAGTMTAPLGNAGPDTSSNSVTNQQLRHVLDDTAGTAGSQGGALPA